LRTVPESPFISSDIGVLSLSKSQKIALIFCEEEAFRSGSHITRRSAGKDRAQAKPTSRRTDGKTGGFATLRPARPENRRFSEPDVLSPFRSNARTAVRVFDLQSEAEILDISLRSAYNLRLMIVA
jgi:hypothetical protein